ncbi:MAG: carboxypeptidase regulatory-like domain-containing protein [Candidatus Riflebacteria bacterium]|nr:carboxypeptidase regulatory-like domain-containing protein [Candidatus Riflebacteria bacterium]
MMNEKVRWVLLELLIVLLPFVVGCFGTGSHNPVADTSLAQAGTLNSIVASGVAQVGVAKVMGAKYVPPVLPSRKYTFAEPCSKISYRIRDEEHEDRPGCLRLRIISSSKADHIFITLGEVRVKSSTSNGSIKLPIASREIDLLQAADVSQALADAQPAVGSYTYMEFRISSGRVVIGGKSYDLSIPSDKIKFYGAFEIKKGYRTELSITLASKLTKTNWFWKARYVFVPIVKISSTLVALDPPVVVTDGNVAGVVTDFVKKTPIQGVTATLEGTTYTAVSTATGAFTFSKVLAGDYNLKLSHPDYMDKSFSVTVSAGQVVDAVAEMNPAIISSNIASTGWFSTDYPVADANGYYGEIALETPLTIDFASLAFVKAEMAFDGAYSTIGEAYFATYMSSTQQVQIIQNLGTWWVGNYATLGQTLGSTFVAAQAPRHYVVDVTDYIRNNPNAQYFLAACNYAVNNISLQNIKLTIYYR